MSRRGVVGVLVAALLLTAPTASPPAEAAERTPAPVAPEFTPGAPGAGDPYAPLAGNGGYDVRSYGVALQYTPATDRLNGRTTVRARATQDLSSFNLDLDGLTVVAVTVDGRRARWSRSGGELTVTPSRGVQDGRLFWVEVRYAGVPRSEHTRDGMVVTYPPAWWPVSNHPSDKATYRLSVTVPTGLEVVASGGLVGRRAGVGWTTWRWSVPEPAAAHLVRVVVGELEVRRYEADGVRFRDAVGSDLLTPRPRTGRQAAMTPGANGWPYLRLARTLTVPRSGGTLSFWAHLTAWFWTQRLIVEVHPIGSDAWTTLPDTRGHTTRRGVLCPSDVHPFLEHYVSVDDRGRCRPEGTTGQWWGSEEETDGFEQWTVDLDRYAGRRIGISLTYLGLDAYWLHGLVVDDIRTSWGQGSTSFEDDGDTWDGWTAQPPVPGNPPGGFPPADGRWVVGTAADVPSRHHGAHASRSLAGQADVVRFLEGVFGPYPFRHAGGVVPDHDLDVDDEQPALLPGHSRSIHNFRPFYQEDRREVVGELAQQWTGAHVTIERWRDRWLDEGLARYAEWLWLEHEREDFSIDEEFRRIGAEYWGDPLWDFALADPVQVHDHYRLPVRGALALHALRILVGDDDFFRLVKTWVAEQGGGNVTTEEFVETAERVSGRDLSPFVDEWLYEPGKPDVLPGEDDPRG